MSRIGKKPVEIIKGVEVKVTDGLISVKGPKGTLTFDAPKEIKVKVSEGKVIFERGSDSKEIKAKHGLTRALVANMVKGVSEGFNASLELVGVGYKVVKQGKNLQLSVGYSHPVEIIPPEGIEFIVEGANKIKVLGADKQVVGQVAADIRGVRPPEPYKGKGIRYSGEIVRKKAGKVAKVGAAA